MVAGIADCSNHWSSIIVGLAKGCCCDDCSTHGWRSNVGVGVGRRSWTVDVWRLVRTVWVLMHFLGLLTCWREGLRVVPLVWLLLCIVMSSAILLSSFSRA